VSVKPQLVRLSELCRFQNGGTPSKTTGRYFTGTVPWITGADLTGQIANQARSFITEEAIASSATNRVSAGTVLLVTRTSVGKVAIAGVDLCFSQDITAITPDASKLAPEYLVHFLRNKEAHFKSHARGATIQGITRQVVADIEVPLPLLPEQRRIAAILDQAEALRTQRRAALAHLDSLTQSIFLDMFGDPVTNDRGWPRARIDSFVAGFESGKSLVADDEDDSSSAFRVLKVSAVTSLEYKPDQSKALPSDYVPPSSHIVRAGDLLFSRANTTDLIGATAFVDQTPDNLLLPDKLWRFVWHSPPRTTPLYVRHLFRQPKFRQEIGQRASGTSGSMKNISQGKVLSIEVGHPPLPLQHSFATRVQAIEALKTKHRSALAQLDTLFASLQHRAFNGELTAKAPTQPEPRRFAELGQLNPSKGLEALVYAARRLPNQGHYWPLKAQYVADRRHLERHGRTLYGETHVAMPYGPVPQAAYNASRALANGELICEFPMDAVRAALRRDDGTLVALRDADPDVLGADERESLDWAIRLVADMSFEELKTQTHDAAWEKTPRNEPMAWQDIVATLDPAAQQRLRATFE
jgi:type I restriction enzyme S subunit